MAKSIAARPKKRGPGRPATGRDPMLGLRVPKELTAAVDTWAKAHAIESRSEAIRRLVERGLAAKDPEKP
jgi:hypothetical protein